MAVEDLKKSKILQGKDAINKLRGGSVLPDVSREGFLKSVSQKGMKYTPSPAERTALDIGRTYVTQGYTPSLTRDLGGVLRPLEALPEPVKAIGGGIVESFVNAPRNIGLGLSQVAKGLPQVALTRGQKGGGEVLKGVGQTATGILPFVPVGGAITGAGVRQAITQGIKA